MNNFQGHFSSSPIRRKQQQQQQQLQVEQQQQQQQQQRLKSFESDQLCYVRFVNTSYKTVDLIWLDYEGKGVKTRSLLPQTAHSILTYHLHPWIFVDSDNRERLTVKKADGSKGLFFEAQNYLNSLKKFAGEKYSKEKLNEFYEGRALFCVFIETPVDRLRFLAFKTVRKCLKKKEDCFCLEVPQPIQFELAQTFI